MANEDNTKLTTVKILKTVYSSFKKLSIDTEINLQKVVNRSLDLYIKDSEFRKKVDKYTELQISGSQF
jgi:hypothetical protein